MKKNKIKVKRNKIFKKEKKVIQYEESGWYYVTLTTSGKQCLFGKIENEKMTLNDNGIIVKDEWLKSAEIRKEVQLDDFVIMPNHIHGIVMISQKEEIIKPLDLKSPQRIEKRKYVHPKKLLDAFISGFKSSTSDQINDRQNTQQNAIWQRTYDEHTIKNKEDYKRLTKYIFNNPKNWDHDIENIKNST